VRDDIRVLKIARVVSIGDAISQLEVYRLGASYNSVDPLSPFSGANGHVVDVVANDLMYENPVLVVGDEDVAKLFSVEVMHSFGFDSTDIDRLGVFDGWI